MSRRRRSKVPPTRGGGVAFLLPSIPDDATVDEKDRLAGRNQANVEGVCPDCGATPELYADTDHESVFHAVFRHEEWCSIVPPEAAA